MQDIVSAIRSGLSTVTIGKRILYFPQVTSTMVIARKEVLRETPGGTVIIADRQTTGKGRIKRGWSSPEGSISLSITLYPELAQLPYLTMIASLAALHSIWETAGIQAELKWPNDVLIKSKKVCGILAESDVCGSKVLYAIIGIGINANFEVSDYPEIPATATSLSMEAGRVISRVDIIISLLRNFERLYLGLANPDVILKEWQSHLVTLGQKVTVSSGNQILTGIAESVAADGSLLLRHADGTHTSIVAGDVTLRNLPE
ncbi:biotin--[acetyl-CoA-carboxylase] ligase [Chloroflexota bacterium]